MQTGAVRIGGLAVIGADLGADVRHCAKRVAQHAADAVGVLRGREVIRMSERPSRISDEAIADRLRQLRSSIGPYELPPFPPTDPEQQAAALEAIEAKRSKAFEAMRRASASLTGDSASGDASGGTA